jgi:hypothetical protein
MLQGGRRDERVGEAQRAPSPKAPGPLGDRAIHREIGHGLEQPSDAGLLGSSTGEQLGARDG